MTGHPKTGDELFEIMKSDFKYAEETYGVEIIACVPMTGPMARRHDVSSRPGDAPSLYLSAGLIRAVLWREIISPLRRPG
jgi:hypothetical protein